MAWPSTITSFTNPTPTQKLNSPSHSSIETAQNTGLTELQTFLGTMGASALGTLIGTVYNPTSDGGGHVQTANKGGTGQTSYAKGDLLIGQSSSVLTKLAVGATDGFVLKADSTQPTGITWGNAVLSAPTVRVYTSSVAQIWNKPSNLSFIQVQLVGGGGAGASSANPSRAGGAGGGGGGYTSKIIPAASVGIAVSVRAGGGGLGSIMAIGSSGGLSYFGSLLSALGGVNGGTAGVQGEVTPGTGGSASIVGDFQVVGSPGEVGYDSSIASFYYSGNGGNSFLGGGGAGIVSQGIGTNGNSATGYGGGGGGAFTNQSSVKGGDGGPGVVIVYEY